MGKNPGSIYLDKQTYEDGMHILTTWEIYLEVLDGKLLETCLRVIPGCTANEK